MSNPPTLEHARVWSRHWRSGAPHSCAGSYGAVYGGAIAAFWRQVHRDTPAGARVLDLATGNGAVPRLLMTLRPDLACEMVGIDVADPVGGSLPTPDGIAARLTLLGGQALEALPVEDASIDLITSQYGIEYGDVERALDEAMRACAPAGRLAFVLHHAGSRPVQLAAVELEHLRWLRGDDGLVTAAAGLIEPLSRSATAAGRAALAVDAAANAARRRFNAAQGVLRERSRDPDGADVLGEVQDAINRVMGTAVQAGEDAARTMLSNLCDTLDDTRFRLSELRRCALDESALVRWSRRLSDRGFSPRTDTVVQDGHILGWSLLAVRQP